MSDFEFGRMTVILRGRGFDSVLEIIARMFGFGWEFEIARV